MNNKLMENLAISKKIMDAHNNIPRAGNDIPPVEEELPIPRNLGYNIPDGLLSEEPQKIQNTNPQPITEDAVKNSNLPDEIKRLMIEHPIQQPQLNSPTLSNDVIEGAKRLMGTENKRQKPPAFSPQQSQQPAINNDLKQMIRDVIRDTVRDVIREELKEAGMITESETETNENLVLKVGNHIFQGKITKVKKTK